MKKRICTLSILFFSWFTAYGKIFYVNTGSDQPNISIGTCDCVTANGGCSFVAAIQASQSCPGLDTIWLLLNVNLGTSQFFSGMIVTETTVIEGNNHFVDLTNVDTTNGRNRILMVVTASNFTVRNLRIIQSPFSAFFVLEDHFAFEGGGIVGRGIDFGSAAIELRMSDSSRIENSFFGDNGLAVRFVQSNYGLYKGCTAIGNQHSNGTFFDSSHGLFQDLYLKGSDHFNAFCIFGAHHNVFKHIVFDEANLSGMTFGVQSQVDSLNVRNNVVDSCLFLNNGWDGISFGEFVDSTTVTNNDFLNNGYGISGGSSTGNQFSRNTFRNCLGPAIQFTSLTHSVIDSNGFDANNGDVISLRLSSNISMTGNRIGITDPNVGSAITFAACRNLVMKGNIIKKGAYGIMNTDKWEGTWSSQILIDSTVIDSTNFDGINTEDVDTLAIKNTTAKNCGGNGFNLASVTQGNFSGNTALQNQGAGGNFFNMDTLLIENSAFLLNGEEGSVIRNSANVSVANSTFSSNNGNGKVVENSSQVSITGSNFGIDSTGLYGAFNGGDALILMDSLEDVIVGGSEIDDRNYFSSDSNTISVFMDVVLGSTISFANNFVGLNKEGEVIGNGRGMVLAGKLYGVTVDEVIASGSHEAGIVVRGDGSTITNTRIGTDTAGVVQADYENEYGILIIETASDNKIGGMDTSNACTIAGNNLFGVAVAGDSSLGFPYRNSIVANSIFDNGGNGIDIINFTDSVIFGNTPNDTTDSDDGPNGSLNYPCVESVSPGYVVYNFDGPAGLFRIDVYSDSVLSVTGWGEGKKWIGYDLVSIVNAPIIGRVLNIPSIMSGDIITMTATECLTNDCQTLGGTSEFSNAFQMNEGGGLPIELVSMTAEGLGNCHVLLRWETASEKDNMGFVILKNNESMEFDSIGWVGGVGNSSVFQEYSFEDISTTEEKISYYRLQQIDWNGVSELFSVVAVMRKCAAQEVILYDILGQALGVVKIHEFENYARSKNLHSGWYIVGETKMFWINK